MADWLTILIKALAGGTLVIAFALLGETLKPKRFAGLFGAAPAVALAGLTVVLATKGAHDAREDARGALPGAIALGAFAAVGAALFGEMAGGVVLALASAAWAIVAVWLYFALWRPGRAR